MSIPKVKIAVLKNMQIFGKKYLPQSVHLLEGGLKRYLAECRLNIHYPCQGLPLPVLPIWRDANKPWKPIHYNCINMKSANVNIESFVFEKTVTSNWIHNEYHDVPFELTCFQFQIKIRMLSVISFIKYITSYGHGIPWGSKLWATYGLIHQGKS